MWYWEIVFSIREFTSLSCSCKFHSIKEPFLQQKLKLKEKHNVDNSISQLLSSSRRKTAQLKVENSAQTTLDVSPKNEVLMNAPQVSKTFSNRIRVEKSATPVPQLDILPNAKNYLTQPDLHLKGPLA